MLSINIMLLFLVIALDTRFYGYTEFEFSKSDWSWIFILGSSRDFGTKLLSMRCIIIGALQSGLNSTTLA